LNMNKTLLIVVAFAVVVVGGFFTFNSYKHSEKPAPAQITDYKNAEYTIEGQRVQLKNGVAETEAAPGSGLQYERNILGMN
jgi:hypothetical protein